MADKVLDEKLYPELAHLWKRALYKSSDIADGVRARLDELQALHDKWMAKITQINRNKGLTGVGKAAAFRELKIEIAKERKDWSRILEGYGEQIGRLERDAQPTRHPRDDVAWEIRAAEIRAYLRTLDPTEVEGRVLSAAANGDDEILQAITYSPIPFKFTTEGLIEKISRQRWEAQNPADAAKLHDLQRAQSEAVSALKSAEAELARQGLERLSEVPVEDDAAA